MASKKMEDDIMQDAVVSKEEPPKGLFTGLRGRRKKEAEQPEIPKPIVQPVAPPVQQQIQQEPTVRDVILSFGNEIEELRMDYIRLVGYLEGKGFI